jgi:hypothetical protein
MGEKYKLDSESLEKYVSSNVLASQSGEVRKRLVIETEFIGMVPVTTFVVYVAKQVEAFDNIYEPFTEICRVPAEQFKTAVNVFNNE